MSRSLKIAGVEVRSSSRTSTSTRNPRPTPGHPHSTRKSRNSPASISNIEFRMLELQRFRVVSKNDRGKLRASFVWGQSVHRSAGRPSGALHVGDVCVAVTSLARHGRCPPALRPCLRPRQCPPRRWPLLCEISEWFPSNVARNSPASISNIEFRTLELQRFRVVSKNDRGKLRATFVVIQQWGELLP